MVKLDKYLIGAIVGFIAVLIFSFIAPGIIKSFEDAAIGYAIGYAAYYWLNIIGGN